MSFLWLIMFFIDLQLLTEVCDLFSDTVWWWVTVPPQIYPFVIAEPGVGSDFLIQCSIYAGDSPIDLTWYKDGRPFTSARMASTPHDLFQIPREHHEPEGPCGPLPESSSVASGPGGHGSSALEFKGLKDGVDPLISVTQLGDRFSVLKFSPLCPHHSGNYTCVAANLAGSTMYTDALIVRGNCCKYS